MFFILIIHLFPWYSDNIVRCLLTYIQNFVLIQQIMKTVSTPKKKN